MEIKNGDQVEASLYEFKPYKCIKLHEIVREKSFDSMTVLWRARFIAVLMLTWSIQTKPTHAKPLQSYWNTFVRP